MTRDTERVDVSALPKCSVIVRCFLERQVDSSEQLETTPGIYSFGGVYAPGSFVCGHS